MSTNSRDNELLDNDPTDELPILLETAVLDPAVAAAAVAQPNYTPLEEATGEHTAHYPVTPDASSAAVDDLKHDLEARGAKIESLEADIRKLSARWVDVERHLSDKEALIEHLTGTLATSKQAFDDRVALEQRLATEIADREKQLAQALDELERQRQQNAAQQLELDSERRRHKAVQTELEATRDQLAEQTAKPPAAPLEGRLQMLQEEIETLTGYIANRRSRWEELEARTASAGARIGELERELAHRETRQQAAEQLAQSEMARAESLRRELVDMSRATETRDQEIAALRAAHAEPQANIERLRGELDHATKLNLDLQAELEASSKLQAASAAAQREADVEYQRTELAKHAADLRAKDRQLERAAGDLEQVRRELAETRVQLEQSRADIERFERALLDKDRSLDARNQRIATLQQELDQKLGALQKLNAMDLSLQGLDSKMSERLKSTDPADQARDTPVLLGLTGDAPRHYALSKSTMTVGRSSQCDIQVFTHFVSREHAKLTVDRSRVAIEDLGSTNGLFVNSVRVARHELRHGDVVTIGETQFRFLERTSH